MWHAGSKSFCEIFSRLSPSGHIRQEAFEEATPPNQLEEAVFLNLFHRSLILARSHPERHYQWTRYDHESMLETENNRPFREGAMEKTITYDGHRILVDMGGVI